MKVITFNIKYYLHKKQTLSLLSTNLIQLNHYPHQIILNSNQNNSLFLTFIYSMHFNIPIRFYSTKQL